MELKQDDQAHDSCSSSEQTQSESLKLSDLLACIGKSRPDDELGDETPADAKALRKRRRSEIRASIKLLRTIGCSAWSFLYVLMEPEEDVVRYVGVASDPTSRFDAHIHDSRKPRRPASKWIRSLTDRGTLPRMWVLAEVYTHNEWHFSHFSNSIAIRAIEKELVNKCLNGNFWGNGHIKSALLNIEHVPQIFLSAGIDAQQDRI